MLDGIYGTEGTGGQRIFPSMTFECSGNISKWTFVARNRTGEGQDQYPLFQLWRPDGTELYERVYESSSVSGKMFSTVDESGLTVVDYVPQNPVPFQAGYILGVYQPGDVNKRRLSLWYASVKKSYGYYFGDLGMSLKEFDTSESTTGYNYPLIAVNTSESQN